VEPALWQKANDAIDQRSRLGGLARPTNE